MKVLVDTCTFLWMADDAPELSTHARTVVTDPDNEAEHSGDFGEVTGCQCVSARGDPSFPRETCLCLK